MATSLYDNFWLHRQQLLDREVRWYRGVPRFVTVANHCTNELDVVIRVEQRDEPMGDRAQAY
jgi:hypothetical protein